MILKEFQFTGISFTSCVLDGTQPFKLIVERIESVKCVAKSVPTSVKRRKVTCRKSTAPPSSFKIRKLNSDKDRDDKDDDSDTNINVFGDFDGGFTSEDDSTDEESVQRKRSTASQDDGEKPVKGKTKKSPYPSALEVQNAILHDLHLQLQPKIHIVRTPSFMLDLNDPASEIDQIYTTFSNNLFKDVNGRIDYIYRHIPQSKKPDGQDIDDDNSFPTMLLSKFNSVDSRKRMKIGEDSDGNDNDGEPEILPVVKKKRARMSFAARIRKRVVSSESESDEEGDENDGLEDIMLDTDDENEEEVVLNETEEKEYAALPEEEKREFLKNRRRKYSKRTRRRQDLITLSSDDEETTEIVEDLAIPGTSAQKDNLNMSSQGSVRKNIKRVLTEAELEKATKEATSKERKRLERLTEQEKQYNKLLPAIEAERSEPSLILDIDTNTNKARVEVNSILLKEMKPHQREGIKFLYNATIENVDKLKEEGSGCILAHCMGLGKSLQVISFVHTLLSNPLTKAHIRTILVVVPVNTLKNWAEEFEKWITKKGLKCFNVYEMVDEPGLTRRAQLIENWTNAGGILIIGIPGLAVLLNLQDPKKKAVSPNLVSIVEKYFVDPGPDLLIIDEGHLLKDHKTRICKSVERIRTKRKIVLTGTPLQNNLDEYHTMISIIKPRLLGSKKEFANRFRNPIENGQKADSNMKDVRLMKQRSTILNKLLSGCIQRFGYETLKPFLKPKLEYTIFIRPSQRMAKMYNFYIDQVQKDSTNRLLWDATTLRLCVNHPALYKMQADTNAAKTVTDPSLKKDWYKQFSQPDDCENIELSGKFIMLFKILRACNAVGDKLLVVSQSLETLDLIEKFLQSTDEITVYKEKLKLGWAREKNYFRIDGNSKADHRLDQVKKFNDPENTDARLFLLSTKAGGVGINLIGANRCIIFDVSWNPSDDIQAIFRVYRFGQPKRVYVYRFVTKDTMEEKIFRKQIVKLGMSIRVVDQHQVTRNFKTAELAEFYLTRPKEEYEVSLPVVPADRLLADILHIDNKVVLECTEFDSLLEKNPDEELTEEERQAAWSEYQKERDAEIQAAEERKQVLEVLQRKNDELMAKALQEEEERINLENEKKKFEEILAAEKEKQTSASTLEASTSTPSTVTPSTSHGSLGHNPPSTSAPSHSSTLEPTVMANRSSSTSATGKSPVSTDDLSSLERNLMIPDLSWLLDGNMISDNNNNNNNNNDTFVAEKITDNQVSLPISEQSTESSAGSSSATSLLVRNDIDINNFKRVNPLIYNLKKHRTALAYKALARPRPMIPNLSNIKRPRRNRTSEPNNSSGSSSNKTTKNANKLEERSRAEAEATMNAIDNAFQNRRVYNFETASTSSSSSASIRTSTNDSILRLRPKSAASTFPPTTVSTRSSATVSSTPSASKNNTQLTSSRTVHQPNLRQHLIDQTRISDQRPYSYLNQHSSNQYYPEPDRTSNGPRSSSSTSTSSSSQQLFPPPQVHQTLSTSTSSAFTGITPSIDSSRHYNQTHPNAISTYINQPAQPYSGYHQPSLPTPIKQSTPYHLNSSHFLANQPFTPPEYHRSHIHQPSSYSNGLSFSSPSIPPNPVVRPAANPVISHTDQQNHEGLSSSSLINSPEPYPPAPTANQPTVVIEEMPDDDDDSYEEVMSKFSDLDLATCSFADIVRVLLLSGTPKCSEPMIEQFEKIRSAIIKEIKRLEIQSQSDQTYSESSQIRKLRLENILQNLDLQVTLVAG